MLTLTLKVGCCCSAAVRWRDSAPARRRADAGYDQRDSKPTQTPVFFHPEHTTAHDLAATRSDESILYGRDCEHNTHSIVRGGRLDRKNPGCPSGSGQPNYFAPAAFRFNSSACTSSRTVGANARRTFPGCPPWNPGYPDPMNTMPLATTGPPEAAEPPRAVHAVDGGELLRAVELPQQLTGPRRAGADHPVARARQQHAGYQRDGPDDAALVLASLRRNERRVPDFLAGLEIEREMPAADQTEIGLLVIHGARRRVSRRDRPRFPAPHPASRSPGRCPG